MGHDCTEYSNNNNYNNNNNDNGDNNNDNINDNSLFSQENTWYSHYKHNKHEA